MTVIAIDGPAASGKSSVSRRVAARLGFACVNSGLLYRAATREVLRQGADTSAPESIAAALARVEITCGIGDDGESFVMVNGKRADAGLNDAPVNNHVSLVAAVPSVRALVSEILHALAREQPLVMEGRDIGTEVFPETPYKFFLDASPEIRQARRDAEGASDRVAARDRLDSTRKAAPLRPAPDAQIVDTSLLTLEGVADAVIEKLRPFGIVPK
jgi:cytidylate kinase